MANPGLDGYLVFEAYDEDPASAEFLCCSKAMSLYSLYEGCRGKHQDEEQNEIEN